MFSSIRPLWTRKAHIPKVEPAYRSITPTWEEAAEDFTRSFADDAAKEISVYHLAEALACIELARSIKDNVRDCPLRKAFPEVKTRKEAEQVAMEAFFKAVGQENPDHLVEKSWGKAGAGYAHQRGPLTLQGLSQLVNTAGQAAENASLSAKMVIGGSRVALQAYSARKVYDVGAERLYYKVADELVSVGLPGATMPLRTASYPLVAAVRLPRKVALEKAKANLQQAMEKFRALPPTATRSARLLAISGIRTARWDYAKLCHAVDDYKAAAYASHVEWAPYRQRLASIGSATALIAGKAVMLGLTGSVIGLVGGPPGVIAGAVAGIAFGCWAGTHITYYLLNSREPDNRDKIALLLLSNLKTSAFYHQHKISRREIALQFLELKEARDKNDLSEQERLKSVLSKYFRQDSFNDVWRNRHIMRVHLGAALLKGKFGQTLNKAQKLDARLKTVGSHYRAGPKAKEELRQTRQELDLLWEDLPHFEAFQQKVDSANRVTRNEDRERILLDAVSELSQVRDSELRSLIIGDLGQQMDAGNAAKRLTAGELDKYRLTYSVSAGLAETIALGLTATSAVTSMEELVVHAHGSESEIPVTDPRYQAGSTAGILSSLNSPEVSGYRAQYDNRHTKAIHKKSKEIQSKASLRDARSNEELPQPVEYRSVEELIALREVPLKVNFSPPAATAGLNSPSGNIEVDMTKTDPYWKARKARLSRKERFKVNLEIARAATKTLFISIAGLPSRMVAAVRLRHTRKIRREMEQIDIESRALIDTLHQALQLPETQKAEPLFSDIDGFMQSYFRNTGLSDPTKTPAEPETSKERFPIASRDRHDSH